MPELNLDLLCAKTAVAIKGNLRPEVRKQEIEKLTNDSASVLVESGVYAFFLYLRSREAKEPSAKTISTDTFEMLRGVFPELGQASDSAGRLVQIVGFSTELDRVLLARKLLVQTLTYLRYHAKAMSDKAAPAAGGRG